MRYLCNEQTHQSIENMPYVIDIVWHSYGSEYQENWRIHLRDDDEWEGVPFMAIQHIVNALPPHAIVHVQAPYGYYHYACGVTLAVHIPEVEHAAA